MIHCSQCGASIGPDENFCGSCGTRNLRTESTSFPATANSDQISISEETGESRVPQGFDAESTLAPETNDPAPHPRGTGELDGSQAFPAKTSRAGETPSRRAKPKALEAGKVLNHRYEIVRRIGGGGMGAVYLAKDRNLGDAPRAVKEMIESHLDDL